MPQIAKTDLKKSVPRVIDALWKGESFEIVDGRHKRVVAVLLPVNPKTGDVIREPITKLHHPLTELLERVYQGYVIEIGYRSGPIVGYLAQPQKSGE